MKKFFKRVISLILLTVFCIGVYFITSGYVMYKSATRGISIAEKVKEVRREEDYTTLDNIPDIYEDAVVSVEDSRFYKHPGIDLISILRAVVVNIRDSSFSEGGSTITQQLAKNLYFSNEKKIERKAAELFVVYYLEDNYAKDVILELYINTVYYGDGYYCIKDASKGYFDCLPSQMTDYEATLLAGVPNAPSVYAPTKNPELTIKRQEHVLNRMVECKKITKQQKKEILSDKGLSYLN